MCFHRVALLRKHAHHAAGHGRFYVDGAIGVTGMGAARFEGARIIQVIGNALASQVHGGLIHTIIQNHTPGAPFDNERKDAGTQYQCMDLQNLAVEGYSACAGFVVHRASFAGNLNMQLQRYRPSSRAARFHPPVD